MSVFIPTAPVTLVEAAPPKPQPDRLLIPPLGWRPTLADRPARIRHDATPWRFGGENSILTMTNETFPCRPYLNGGVDAQSKVSMKLAQRPAWVERFIALMGPRLWDKFKTRGFWCMDRTPPNEDLAFDLLPTGGNLVNIVGVVGAWGIIQAQLFQLTPLDLSPIWHPHLHIKQTLITRDLRVIVDRTGVGDLYIPLLADVPAALPLSQLQFYPPVPFGCRIDGWPATVDQLCFAGSNTYGYVVDGLPEGWYLLDEMLVIGDPADINLGGTSDDRRCYADALVGMPCPPPIIGWRWPV